MKSCLDSRANEDIEIYFVRKKILGTERRGPPRHRTNSTIGLIGGGTKIETIRSFPRHSRPLSEPLHSAQEWSPTEPRGSNKKVVSALKIKDWL